ncbi:Phenylacetate-coenzyme A ligase [Methanimicrococcus hongohii]|uniref:Phenylacetate-coenzyme A ligase n=1 Tax=Methanimicrococcus hongohii TaxID=3028295 RepID=A0AA96UYI6_9EURY|nr:phenylacetate--CoA ligase [Methanimicrococcus sp. Hf6]WNY23006.1 Phenylacetate-coenzyme A ligase [Methanimicrococcus sp. Hf6]
MKFWDQKIETMNRKEMEKLQFKRLKKAVKTVYRDVPFYKRKFDDAGAHPDDIRSLADASKLPYTLRSDFTDNYPFGMFAVPIDDIVRIHSSSGTTGKPKVVGYTKHDIEAWGDLLARNFTMVGLSHKDVFQNSVNYGLFTGGLGIHNGIETLGATAIPAGTGNTLRQLEMMVDFGVTALHCTPSYALYLAETAVDNNLVDQLKLKTGCLGAEPWSENMRKTIEDMLEIKAYDSYGLSEMFGPGIAFECTCQDGMHIWDDHFLVEVLDENGEQVAEGEKGELVLTSLTKEGLINIRYKTGDITRLLEPECECGRCSTRISRMIGRADDMIIVRGINVFPTQVQDVISKIPEVTNQFQIILTRNSKNLDEMTVQVELEKDAFTDDIIKLERIQQRVVADLMNVLSIRTSVDLLEFGSIERTGGKAKRVIDNRAPL